MQPGGTPHTWGERVAVALLAVVIVLGSALLWIGMPIGVLWVAAHITDDALTAVLVALLAIPTTMVAFGWVLYRVNGYYERLRGSGVAPPIPTARGVRASARNAQASAAVRAGGR